MGSPPVIPNGKGAAAVVITAWASWVPAVSVVWFLWYLVFGISGEREGVQLGIPPRIERYGSVPPREETPPNRL